MSLGPFQRITVVSVSCEVYAAHTARIPREGRFFWYTDNPIGLDSEVRRKPYWEQVHTSEEGVRWVRGHHALDSDEVKAMRACIMLGKTA